MRVASGCSQAELGARLGKPQSYVSKVEAGDRRLDLVEYIFWAKALDIDPTPLVDDLARSIGKVLYGGQRRRAVVHVKLGG
jgi:transcriptional regulator with XRE-family HTH domain